MLIITKENRQNTLEMSQSESNVISTSHPAHAVYPSNSNSDSESEYDSEYESESDSEYEYGPNYEEDDPFSWAYDEDGDEYLRAKIFEFNNNTDKEIDIQSNTYLLINPEEFRLHNNIINIYKEITGKTIEWRYFENNRKDQVLNAILKKYQITGQTAFQIVPISPHLFELVSHKYRYYDDIEILTGIE
jgi:hypothetical protein